MPSSEVHGGRPRTGGLIRKGALWYARLTIDVDGASMRTTRSLGTDSKQIARAKLKRLLTEDLKPDQAAQGETFEQAARRIIERDEAAGMKTWKDRLDRFERHVFPALGPMYPAKIHTRHIEELLDGVRVTPKGKKESQAPARETLKHVLSDVSVVLDDLWRKELLTDNAAKRVKLPKAEGRTKERAVLTDFEFARYLKWQHPQEDYREAVLERQTMSCIARLFGGVRTGDLHVLRWEHLDATNGRFEWGYAPRSKTANPQRLHIDEMLRPILRRWWEHWKQPREGLVFPVLHDGKNGKAGKGEKISVSHADAFRRDLRRAFGIDELETHDSVRKNGRPLSRLRWVEARKLTPREKELFEETDHTLPVDFHSWRRAYCQALADSGVNAQLAKALAGHTSESAHDRYVRSSDKARALPEQARPRFNMAKVIKSRARA